jgi:hypothetical protein
LTRLVKLLLSEPIILDAPLKNGENFPTIF